MIRFDATNEYAFRNSGIVQPNSDYTVILFFRPLFTPTTTSYATIFYTGDDPTSIYAKYVGVFTDHTDNDKLKLYISDGVTTLISQGTDFDLNTFRTIAYVRTGNDHKFYVNNVLIDTLTLDISADGPYTDFWLGSDSLNNSSSLDYFNCREWDAALTEEEMHTELASTIPVRTLNLWTDYPLLSDADDDSGNGRDLTEVLAPLYYGQPPVYITPATAIEISGVPYTNSINANRSDDLETFSPWLKITCPEGLDGLGVWALGSVGNYSPGIHVYDADLVRWPQPTGIQGSGNKPIQMAANPGDVYYFQLVETVNYDPAIASVSIIGHSVQTVVPGSFFITDDQLGFPAVVISPGSDYNIVRILQGFPTGEAADCLPSGVFLLENNVSGELLLYDREYNLISTIPQFDSWTSYGIRASLGTNRIYFNSNETVKYTDEDGNVTVTNYDHLVGGGIIYGAADNDGRYWYYGQGGSTFSMKKWDLLNGGVVSTFAGPFTSAFLRDPMILQDGTLIFLVKDGSGIRILRYDDSGTLLNTYDITSMVHSSVPRLSRAANNTSFWVFIQRSVDALSATGRVSHFVNINLADGAIINTVKGVEYNSGVYAPAETASPIARFGNPDSCPLMLLFASDQPEAEPLSGIYYIHTGKRNDTVYLNAVTEETEVRKIPDPTISTGLFNA